MDAAHGLQLEGLGCSQCHDELFLRTSRGMLARAETHNLRGSSVNDRNHGFTVQCCLLRIQRTLAFRCRGCHHHKQTLTHFTTLHCITLGVGADEGSSLPRTSERLQRRGPFLRQDGTLDPSHRTPRRNPRASFTDRDRGVLSVVFGDLLVSPQRRDGG